MPSAPRRNRSCGWPKALNSSAIKKLASHPVPICAAAGLAAALPYFAEQAWIFTPISLGLLFYAIEKKRGAGHIWICTFVYFLALYLPLYSFLSELYPYTRFGFTQVQAVFVLVCSCLLIPLFHAALQSTAFLAYLPFCGSKLRFLGFGAAAVIAEWITSVGTLAFPWGGAAVSMTGFLPYIATASLLGRYFITFVTASAAACFVLAAANRGAAYAAAGAAIIAFNLICGSVLYFLPTGASGGETRVAALQGNVLSNEKWASGERDKIFERYISQAVSAAGNGASVIFIPETAIPVEFKEGGRLHSAFSEICTQYGVTIVAGVIRYDSSSEYNSVIAVTPGGGLSGCYDKHHLVPFGEFIPYADILGRMFPFVAEFNNSRYELCEGARAQNISTPLCDIAPAVCFDSIFPQFTRAGTSAGAELIAVVTNDSWFNDSVGIYTHLRHSQLRAIESGKYVVRAANTGISAVIDPHGRITAQTEPLAECTLYADITPIRGKTLYCTLGDTVIYISALAVIAAAIKSYTEKRKNAENSAL